MINARYGIFAQIVLLSMLAMVGWYFAHNVKLHLDQDHIASGFAFLQQEAGFDIIMHLISYSSSSTYLRAFYVGILNTLLLSGLAIIFSTVIGLLVAMARLSHNWLLAKLGTVYIEIFRNMPLLLQVFFWYFVLLHYLPANSNYTWWGFITLNVQGLFIGNLTLIPELTAMLLALSLYSGSFIAENIRAGILAVDKGQHEAAIACGLRHSLIMRLIILPQAAKVIIPPLVSQYLSTLKNSSLGSAIGYPDLVSVFAGTVLNQTGQAIETIFMTMAFYLVLSLVISGLMNLYNRKFQVVAT